MRLKLKVHVNNDNRREKQTGGKMKKAMLAISMLLMAVLVQASVQPMGCTWDPENGWYCEGAGR